MSVRATFPDAPLTTAEMRRSVQGEPVTPVLFWYEVEIEKSIRVTVQAYDADEAERKAHDGDHYDSDEDDCYVFVPRLIGPVVMTP